MAKKKGDRPSLAEVISSQGALVPEWEKTELTFGGDIELDPAVQREILRNYLLVTPSFTQACQLSGIYDSELIKKLELKIPKRWRAMRESLDQSLPVEVEINKNPEVVIPMISAGLKYAEKARILSEVLFYDMSLNPRELKHLVSTWAEVWDRVLPVLESGKASAGPVGGLRELADDVIVTMRERIKEYRIRQAAQELKQQEIAEAIDVEVEESGHEISD